MNKDALEILNNINNFYSSAFNQLITITFGIVAFIGIFLPIITTYYQNRNTRIEKENLEDYITNKVEEMRIEVVNTIGNDLEKKLETISLEWKRENDRAIGGVLHVQANQYLSAKKYKLAANSIFSAIRFYIRGKDEFNLQRSIDILTKSCLPKLELSENPNLERLSEMTEEVINLLDELNDSGRYKDTMTNLGVTTKDTISRLESEKT